MKPWFLIGTFYSTAVAANYFHKKSAALQFARSLSGERGMINLGAGCGRSGFGEYVCELPEVVYNVDLSEDCHKCLTINLEQPLPFSDNQFDVAFASHVLEHLENWQQALNEWTRIASNVVIVLPHPFSISGRLYGEHKQHFSFADMNFMRTTWPTVSVFS